MRKTLAAAVAGLGLAATLAAPAHADGILPGEPNGCGVHWCPDTSTWGQKPPVVFQAPAAHRHPGKCRNHRRGWRHGHR